MLDFETIIKLRRWNTPTIYNGWEAISSRNRIGPFFNREPLNDFTPTLGSIAGYAVTVKIEPSNPAHLERNKKAWEEYRAYIAAAPGPKIIVVQDLDYPDTVGAYWGEVNSSIHKRLGCVGTITDGAARDIDEIETIGFKVLARRLCVGHAWSYPVEWNTEVEVFGTKVAPGDFIHADKHGFLIIPTEDQQDLLKSSIYLDNLECETVIRAAQDSNDLSTDQVLEEINTAAAEYSIRFNAFCDSDKKGEW